MKSSILGHVYSIPITSPRELIVATVVLTLATENFSELPLTTQVSIFFGGGGGRERKNKNTAFGPTYAFKHY